MFQAATTEDLPRPVHARERFASVDLGSNSFRLWIAELNEQARLVPIANHKFPVRLAAGVGPGGVLDPAALQRAQLVLQQMGKLIQESGASTVRALATSTFRIASNALELLRQAQLELGCPVEIVSGLEEARLIYKGVSKQLPTDHQDRLVLDIGGGSTECIIGHNERAKLVDSAVIGCVFVSDHFFPRGEITMTAMNQAIYRARDHFAPLAPPYKRLGWKYAIGTSGTAKSLVQFANAHFGVERLSRQVLGQMIELLVQAGSSATIPIEGLKPERRPVLAGGLAVMAAAFDEFGMASLSYSQGALRQGALYDLIERREGMDIQSASVEMLKRRYAVDDAQSRRMYICADKLLSRMVDVVPARLIGPDLHRVQRGLHYAAQLAEIGLAIAHEDFGKHGSYILSQSDIPGFSKPEQALLARLTLGQYGSLATVRDVMESPQEWVMLLCLRWASILNRQRAKTSLRLPSLQWTNNRLIATWPKHMEEDHPVTHATLIYEASYWNSISLELKTEMIFA